MPSRTGWAGLDIAQPTSKGFDTERGGTTTTFVILCKSMAYNILRRTRRPRRGLPSMNEAMPRRRGSASRSHARQRATGLSIGLPPAPRRTVGRFVLPGASVLPGDMILHRTLAPGRVHVVRLPLLDSRRVTLVVTGDGRSDLDVLVVAPDASTAAADFGATDRCCADFIVAQSGVHEIRVINHGPRANRFRLAMMDVGNSSRRPARWFRAPACSQLLARAFSRT